MKKLFKEWKKTLIILGGIIILALLIRLINLTILPVFADEAIYIRWSQIMANEATLRFLPLSDGKQPLFMWALMFFVNKISDPLFAGRMLSVATGIGTLLGVFFLSNYIFKSKKVALASAFFWAISPFSVFFDRMALVDSMLTFFGVWTLFGGLAVAKTKRLDLAMLTGFSLGFASLTKSSAVFFAALLSLNLIFLKKVFGYIKYLALLSVSFVIAFGMYNIQRLGPNFHLLTSRTKDYVFPLSKILSNPLDPVIYNFPSAIGWIFILGPSVILLFGILGTWFNYKKFTKEVLILLAWFLGPIIFQSIFAKTFTARYILFTLPSFYILSASVFLVEKKWIKKVLVVLVAVFIAHSVYTDYYLLTNPLKAPLPRRERMGYLEEWSSGIGIKEVSEFLKKEAGTLQPGEKIVVGTEGYFGTLPDGLQIYLKDYPNVVVIGVGVNLTELPQSLRESKEAGNKTYLVINNSRLRAKPDELGLNMISSYPKGLRHPRTSEYKAFGPQEFLYFFEVGETAK